MKHSVIVIDDQLPDRRKGYELLAEKTKLVPGFEVSFDFVETPNQLLLMTKKNHYAAAIVDAVLDDNWPGYTLTKALHDLGDEIPIALLSGRWDLTNAEQIDEAWKKPNCRTFLHWRDINPEGNGQIDYAVRAFVSMIADKENLDTQLNLGPDEPIRILHISDVQTGGYDDKSLKLEASRCADHILQHWSESRPTFVAFTGDVSEHGNPAQYTAAKDWIKYFFARLRLGNIPARTLLYVPGNHDVNLPLAAAARIKLGPDKKTGELGMTISPTIQQAELVDYAYTPFLNFLKEITDCPMLRRHTYDNSMAWVESRFRHLGIVFYGLNTAQPANSYGLPSREVSSNALAMIGEELEKVVTGVGGKLPLVIGLGHHCPVSASADNAVDNPEEFEKFFRGRVKTGLFLHGHSHDHALTYFSSDGLRIVRSCATTLTKKEEARPKDSLRGFNLLELARKDHEVVSLSACSFGWVGTDIKELKKDAWVRKGDGMFKEI